MSFKFVMVPPNLRDYWPAAIREAVPQCEVLPFETESAAKDALKDADAAYGTISVESLKIAEKLRWICAPQAGLGGNWFYPELKESEVIVTNTRGIFNDHLSQHILGLIVAHSRQFFYYKEQQRNLQWGPARPIQHLANCTILIIGAGEAGQATGKLAKEFGMHVIATDVRVSGTIAGIDELHPADALESLLPRADYVVMIVPETPQTKDMMAAEQFAHMKSDSYLINVGRGSTLVMDDLAEAIENKQIAGACLDVFQTEPLPTEHKLWTLPEIFITPHVAGEGPYCWERRLELIIENCRRFAADEPLKNVVDKQNWF